MLPRLVRNRREALVAAASVSVLGALPRWVAAAALPFSTTPPQTEGPFYPASLPLEQDNDLVAVGGNRVTARGVLTNVVGRVLDTAGRPLQGLHVEIWQCDAMGEYHNLGARTATDIDAGFQGFGHFVTGPDGAYRFRTIRPVPYSGRPPHIHFKLSGPGFRGLTTQLYVAGEPRNEHDGLLGAIRDPRAREMLMARFVPDTLGDAELMARFDIVV